MMESSFYANLDITVFGVQFANCTPLQIIQYFMDKSIFKKYNTIDEYMTHLNRFMEVPEREEGESDGDFVERLFHEFHKLGILKIDEAIH